MRQDRAMINIVSRSGESALHLARHSVSTVQSLVACAQCDLDIADAQGRTPLHCSAADPGLVRILVTAGASVSVQDQLGNTPAHLLMLETTDHVTESLYTNTAVQEMISREMLETIKTLSITSSEQIQICILLYLVNHGAKLDQCNYYGQTVLDLVENDEVRKFVQETVMRGVTDDQAQLREAGTTQSTEHEYAEILENSTEEAREATEETVVHRDEARGGDDDETWRAKYEALEEQSMCAVCLERIRNVAFNPCGHSACSVCTPTLHQCPMCRKNIESTLNLY